jgi:hypothetical protein
MSNLDAALSSLATEVNELEADRKTDNNSKQGAMGHKLIAIRELLRERNGVVLYSRPDATGCRAPKYWYQWVKDNLTISPQHASTCIRYAIAPEEMRAQKAEKNKRLHQKNPIGKIQNYLRTHLPYCTQDEKERILNTVYNSFKKADAA